MSSVRTPHRALPLSWGMLERKNSEACPKFKPWKLSRKAIKTKPRESHDRTAGPNVQRFQGRRLEGGFLVSDNAAKTQASEQVTLEVSFELASSPHRLDRVGKRLVGKDGLVVLRAAG